MGLGKPQLQAFVACAPCLGGSCDTLLPAATAPTPEQERVPFLRPHRHVPSAQGVKGPSLSPRDGWSHLLSSVNAVSPPSSTSLRYMITVAIRGDLSSALLSQ